MPILKINEFPSGSGSLSNDDLFLVMDNPGSSGVTKNISLNDIVTSSKSLSYLTTSSPIDGTIDDWDPESSVDIIRTSGINNARINGLVDTYGLDAVVIYNVGTTDQIILSHASGTSENQFLVPWLGDYILLPNGGFALAIRDKVDNKWRIT